MFTTKLFTEHEFLLEYAGELITKEEGEERHVAYEKENVGSFLFVYKNQWLVF